MSDVQTDEERKEAMRVMLRKCGIPYACWKHSLPEFGETGKAIRAWLCEEYIDGKLRKDGIGAVLSGNPRQRVLAFSTLGKELIITGESALFITLRKLTDMLMERSEELDRYDRVKCLLIDNFQTSSESPYTWAERSYVENFISERMDEAKPTMLNISKRLQEADWWSADFRVRLENFSKEFVFK